MCIVGSGGREHALAHVLAREAEVVVCPGNPAAPYRSVGGPPESVEADLYVIGPEAPLVDGLADRLRASGRLVVGPGRDGACLEGSKGFAKEIMREAGVATAAGQLFEDLDSALAALNTRRPPYVIKADGLAAGKGVLVTDDPDEAKADLAAKLSGRAFGPAGQRVLLEDYLDGPELSVLALSDGRRAIALAPAQDFKRLADGDQGPNTGGMGAYSPVPMASARVLEEVMGAIVEPVLACLARRGIDYRGILYAGLALTGRGPAVIEFNVRLGDPEAQAVLSRLDPASSFLDLLVRAAEGRLAPSDEFRFRDDAAVTVVMGAPGYPAAPRLGGAIDGLELAGATPGVTVFHSGTALGPQGETVVGGGRVLSVTGSGDTLAVARARAYEAVGKISFAGGASWRRDIALDAAMRA